jgi:hypothetical protein
MQQAPKRSSRAELKNDAEIRLFGASSQEQNNIWMSNNFHDSTLILELLKLILFDDLSFYLLNSYSSMLPPSTVDYTVATFRELPVKLQVSIVDFIVGLECLVVTIREH